MKKAFLVIICLLAISFVLFGCQQKNYACVDGTLVKYKSDCPTECGNCECENLEHKGNCPQDCDPNYWTFDKRSECPACAPFWDESSGTCIAGRSR